MRRTTPASAVGVPVELNRFIGRERELLILQQLAAGSRLLTLTGAGGSGKSRLALELVPKLGVDGVYWVELAPVAEPGLVASATLRAIDPTAEAGGDATTRLIDTINDQAILLVLDNCEHVVDAAASLAESLLRACPALHIIATSREALGVQGERAWLVPPLSLQDDAVRLFEERARDVASDFRITDQNAAIVAAICARLDGIPLAIELAAARVRLLPLEQIHDRLSDAFALLTTTARRVLPRHRTLRAAIDWSHELLADDARAVLRRLSVFRAPFTLDAAEAVASADDVGDYDEHDVAARDVLDLVAALLDRSLLSMREHDGSARYFLLETMRQYAAARLNEARETDDAMKAMSLHFERLIAEVEPDFTTRRRQHAFKRLEPDLDNIRDVLVWSYTHDPALHVRMVGLLWWFWFSTRHWVEARRWLDGALALPPAASGTLRARLLFASGALSALQANPATARAQLMECIDTCHATADRTLEAYALNYLAMTYAQLGAPEGREYAGRAAEWLRASRDEYGLRLSLLLMGMGEAAAGDSARARELLREAVQIARTFGQDRELGVALQTFAGVSLDAGDPVEAEALLTESLHALRRDWSHLFGARAVDQLAVTVAARDPREAARRIGAGDALRAQVGADRFKLDQQRIDVLVPKLRDTLGDTQFDELYAYGQAHETEILQTIFDAAVNPTTDMIPSPGTTASPTVDLYVRTFGPMEVHASGVRIQEWRYAKPKELLAYLLTQPRGRTRAEIAAAIWPESTPAQARNSFHVTMHHLRKALGHADWIVLENERYRVADDVSVQTDARDFETAVRAALRKDNSDLSALRNALDIYTDHYLAGEAAGAWRDEEQDRLRGLYTDAALRLGELLEAEDAADQALTLYEDLVVREPLLEEAHRRLIRYWTASGDRVRAIRHFDRLATVLRDELQLEPDEETLELYERARTLTPGAP